jgi:hypothetical protein
MMIPRGLELYGEGFDVRGAVARVLYTCTRRAEWIVRRHDLCDNQQPNFLALRVSMRSLMR